MMASSVSSRRNAFNPNVRGYHAVYHDGEVNHCPGCGRTHWLIGRCRPNAPSAPPRFRSRKRRPTDLPSSPVF